MHVLASLKRTRNSRVQAYAIVLPAGTRNAPHDLGRLAKRVLEVRFDVSLPHAITARVFVVLGRANALREYFRKYAQERSHGLRRTASLRVLPLELSWVVH